jgi:hypothetical protein
LAFFNGAGRPVRSKNSVEDGRKLFAGTIEAADPRELVLKWSAFLATAERGTYFATYRGSFVGPSRHSRTSVSWLPNGPAGRALLR